MVNHQCPQPISTGLYRTLLIPIDLYKHKLNRRKNAQNRAPSTWYVCKEHVSEVSAAARDTPRLTSRAEVSADGGHVCSSER